MEDLKTMYGRNSFSRGPTRTPVSVGEELDVSIEAVGEKGDGVAKKQGYVIFVPGTKAGETCRIRVTRTLKNVAFAEKIGEAEGPVEQSQRPPQQQEQSETQEEEQQEEAPQEDSEDFGEEEAEEDSDDEESDEEPEEEAEGEIQEEEEK